MNNTNRADLCYADGETEHIYFKDFQEDEVEMVLLDCFEWTGGGTGNNFKLFDAMRITKRHLRSVRFIENATMTDYTLNKYPEIGAWFEAESGENVDHFGDVSI